LHFNLESGDSGFYPGDNNGFTIRKSMQFTVSNLSRRFCIEILNQDLNQNPEGLRASSAIMKIYSFQKILAKV